jgi:DNA transposition AAA+ family ATPase
MSRYPQLFSRVGFAHHYRPLLGDELSFVLTRHWQKLGLQLDGADFTDAQAIASIARITGGNFRLLRRLFLQIERVLQVNELTVITDDVVNAARSNLVIGVSLALKKARHIALKITRKASAVGGLARFRP